MGQLECRKYSDLRQSAHVGALVCGQTVAHPVHQSLAMSHHLFEPFLTKTDTRAI
jgi:hypothetical protein